RRPKARGICHSEVLRGIWPDSSEYLGVTETRAGWTSSVGIGLDNARFASPEAVRKDTSIVEVHDSRRPQSLRTNDRVGRPRHCRTIGAPRRSAVDRQRPRLGPAREAAAEGAAEEGAHLWLGWRLCVPIRRRVHGDLVNRMADRETYRRGIPCLYCD